MEALQIGGSVWGPAQKRVSPVIWKKQIAGLNLCRFYRYSAVLDDEDFSIGSADQCNKTEKQGGGRLGDIIDKAFTIGSA